MAVRAFFTAASASLLLFIAACVGGCVNKDYLPTPMTVSYNMEPVPKHPGPWKIPMVEGIIDVSTGRLRKDALALMDPNDADRRRKAIYLFVARDFGQRPPYTTYYGQLAQMDPDVTVRAAAVRALNASRDRTAIPIFIAALNDKSDLVRLQAAKALSNIPDPTAAEPLSRTLGNQAEVRDVRIAASEALRHYRNPGVARVLVGTVGGRDFSIAWQSRWTLTILTGRDLGYNEQAWLEFINGPGKPLG